MPDTIDDTPHAAAADRIRFRAKLSIGTLGLVWLQLVNWRWQVLSSDYSRPDGALALNATALVLVPLLVAAFVALHVRLGRPGVQLRRGSATGLRLLASVVPAALGLAVAAVATFVVAIALGGGWHV